MTTGRHAFPGSTPGTIQEAVLNRTPIAVGRVNPELSPRLEEIINKALEKDRKLRYQHASELHADLQRLKRDIDSGSIVSRREEAVPRAGTSGWRRKWPLIAGSAFAAVALLAAGMQFSGRSAKGEAITSVAVLPFVNGSARGRRFLERRHHRESHRQPLAGEEPARDRAQHGVSL